MEISVYNILGEVIEQAEISDELFAVPFNESVVHQAMVIQMANRRLGTASSKTRGDVVGSTRKPYRQKHTGRARLGTMKSPLRRGGGVTFGPHPRSYRQRLPKKMRRLALKCVLSAKAQEEQLIVLNNLQLEQPKTKEIVNMLHQLNMNSSVLIVTAQPEENVIKAARNLQGVKTMPVALLSVLDLLSFKFLIISLTAVRGAEQIWGTRTTAAEG